MDERCGRKAEEKREGEEARGRKGEKVMDAAYGCSSASPPLLLFLGVRGAARARRIGGRGAAHRRIVDARAARQTPLDALDSDGGDVCGVRPRSLRDGLQL